MIIFRNPGAIDMRAITTFGLTSKDGRSTIGRFGTGLKYAVATIMRGGGSVTIHTGGEVYQITTEQTDFRGTEHKQVVMNGEALPFTVSLGRDWEPWMAFRELYSNALDEGGGLTRAEDGAAISVEQDKTVISVEWAAFEAIYYTIEEHFIVDEEPLWSSGEIDIYSGRSGFVFYRGIAVMKLKKPSAFRYNLKGYVSLTEDRTAQYPWMVDRAIAKALTMVQDEKIALEVTSGHLEYEGKLDFMEASESEPSATFLGAAAKNGLSCNPTAAKLVDSYVADADTSTMTIISQETPGGVALMASLSMLKALGENPSTVKWVLDPALFLPSGYLVKGKAIFICSSAFEDRVKMARVVFNAWQECRGIDWMSDKLREIATSRIDAEEGEVA